MKPGIKGSRVGITGNLTSFRIPSWFNSRIQHTFLVQKFACCCFSFQLLARPLEHRYASTSSSHSLKQSTCIQNPCLHLVSLHETLTALPGWTELMGSSSRRGHPEGRQQKKRSLDSSVLVPGSKRWSYRRRWYADGTTVLCCENSILVYRISTVEAKSTERYAD